jgi:hypothetical protein
MAISLVGKMYQDVVEISNEHYNNIKCIYKINLLKYTCKLRKLFYGIQPDKTLH